MIDPARDTSPLERLCKQDPEHYEESLRELSVHMRGKPAASLWESRLTSPSLYRILDRWLRIDALERAGSLGGARAAVLRGEALGAYSLLEGDPEARSWALWYLDQCHDDASPEVQEVARAVRAQLDAPRPNRATGASPSAPAATDAQLPRALYALDARATLLCLREEPTPWPRLPIEPGGPIAAATPVASGVVLAGRDGRVLRVGTSREGLALEASTREENVTWTAVCGVTYQEQPAVAAAAADGTIFILSCDRLEVLEAFDSEGSVPTAIHGQGSHLIVATAQGTLRRYDIHAPSRWEAFLATQDRSAITHITWLPGGSLVALTDTGAYLAYDGRDPARMPDRFQPHEQIMSVTGVYDETRALVATRAGGVWLFDPARRTQVELMRRLEPGIVGLSRVGNTLITAHESGAVLRCSVVDDAVAPVLSKPQRATVGHPLVLAWA